MAGSQGLQPLRSTQCHRPSHDSEPRPPFPSRAGHPIVRGLPWRWRCDHRCGSPRPKPLDSPGDHPVFSGSCGHGRPGALKAKDQGRLKPKACTDLRTDLTRGSEREKQLGKPPITNKAKRIKIILREPQSQTTGIYPGSHPHKQ